MGGLVLTDSLGLKWFGVQFKLNIKKNVVDFRVSKALFL